MSTRCEADHKMAKVGTVSLDPKSVSWLDHDGAREAVATDWMRWDVWRCDECAETRVDSTDEQLDKEAQDEDDKDASAMEAAKRLDAIDAEARAKVLTVDLPSGMTVLAKKPGVPYHYANNAQAYRKVLELGRLGVNAFVVGQGKPAKYIRILPGEPTN